MSDKTTNPTADSVEEPKRAAAEQEPQGKTKAKGDDKVIHKSTIILRRFLRNYTAVAGLAIFLGLLLFSLIGGYFSEWDSTTIDPFSIAQEPGGTHYFGTNQAGIDLYAMMVKGIRTSILIGVLVGVISTVISAVYGCAMAYIGGKIDHVMLFILEALIMLPSLLIVAVVTSGGGSKLRTALPGWLLLTIVLIIFGWMGTARLVRSVGMSFIDREFVKAARFMGVSPLKIIVKHFVPNLGSLLVLDLTRGITAAILAEVAFSFIGIGVKAPDVSLGMLIGQASSQVDTYPWMFWYPLIAMFLLTGSLAMMNDGLRDAFDPNSMSVGSAKKKKKSKKGRATSAGAMVTGGRSTEVPQ